VIEKKIISLPKKAATTILLRDAREDGFEAFLLRRSEKSDFMGGMFVYPGGRLEKEDWEHEHGILRDRHEVLSHREWAAAGEIPREEHLALRVAALRELFEEAGVLLAYRIAHPAGPGNIGAVARLTGHRDLLQRGEEKFIHFLRERDLKPAIDSLYYYARWITPVARPIRFDTHFFLARHPSDQEAVPDLRETTQGVWLAPRKALEANLAGRIPLSPPTLKTLEDLARFGTIDDVLSSLSHAPVSPVLPVFLAREKPFIVFPCDPEYDRYRMGENACDERDDAHIVSAGVTTRVVLSEKGWLPCAGGR
jgi:8-oxo-dGTP pyrophosphatase MutT (NUDIX family)